VATCPELAETGDQVTRGIKIRAAHAAPNTSLEQLIRKNDQLAIL